MAHTKSPTAPTPRSACSGSSRGEIGRQPDLDQSSAMSPEPFVTRQKDEVANARAGTRSPLPAACDLTHQSASHQGHTFGVSVAVHADLEGDFSLPPLDNDMAAVQAEPLRHPVERHWTTVQVGTRDVTSGD